MVSIIIPTVDRQQSLVKLVESIQRQEFSAAETEILIVYNFSEKKRPKEFFHPSGPGIKVLQSALPGVNHARNTGIIAARGDILLFIDDDCVMDDRYYLQKLIQRHKDAPQLMAIGGPYNLSAQASFWDVAYFQNMLLWLQRYKISNIQSRALLGGNASYKSVVFSGGRRFTPGIKYGGSETPFNEILFEDYGPHGFYSDLSLTHQSRLSLSGFICKAYMQGRGLADQSKRSAPNVEGPLDTSSLKNRQLRWALNFYSFVFMVGFRSSIYERRYFFISLAEEIFERFKKPFAQFLCNIFASQKILGTKK